MANFGSEGGIYRSPFGQLSLDESGRELSLTLHSANHAAPSSSMDKPPAAVAPDTLARQLLSMAEPGSPNYRGDLASVLEGVSIDPPSTLRVHLRRVHVRPEALLQCRPVGSDVAIGSDFEIAEHTARQVMFARPAATGVEQPSLEALVEAMMPDDESAVAAILSGDIDVLDRVPPWHIERLRAADTVRVANYRLPTIHVLIPNPEHPLLRKREFRRALCFAIDRDWIVRSVLLGGAEVPGYGVVSGPFPAGTSLSDPVRYGYNNQIAARPFEPRLAAILATIAWASVQQPDAKEGADVPELPPLPELRLAHASDPVARVACQTIQAQLQRVGIRVSLEEFSTDDLLAGRVECDLRYAELAVWEPVADARLLMDPGGIAGGIRSAYLDAALHKLDEATNWNDVRACLAALHEIAHHDLPVIPLWQTTNFFAFRANVNGIGEEPMTLYQNIDQWNGAAGKDVARLERRGGNE
jgi:ABC-type transport system substrate-binding protein